MRQSHYERGGRARAGTPFRQKRAVLIRRVTNAGPSHIERSLPTPNEHLQLKSAMGALLRRAMRGGATTPRQDGSARGTTTLDVFRHCP
eukprot:3801610-Pyramimonas_sp.AAC.1